MHRGKEHRGRKQRANKVFEKLKAMGIDIPKKPEITIQNIVASADLHTVLNLNAIAIGLGLENIEYEPEQSPVLCTGCPLLRS